MTTPRYTGPTEGREARIHEAKRHVWPFSITYDHTACCADGPPPVGDTFARGYWWRPETLAAIAVLVTAKEH